MGKKHDLPAMPFYCGDWLKCPEVMSLTRSERSVWLDMLCIMWESTERGVLVTPKGKPFSDDKLCHMLNITIDTLLSIEDSGVFSRREDGAIYSRRMVRDENIRKTLKNNGSKGGNPNLVNQNTNQKNDYRLTKNKNTVNQKPNQYTEDENEDENANEDENENANANDSANVTDSDNAIDSNSSTVVVSSSAVSLSLEKDNKYLKDKDKNVDSEKTSPPIPNVSEAESTVSKTERKEETKSRSKKFIPPTINEIVDFALERNIDDDACAFFYYYDANGWKVGKNKMVNWKSAYLNWVARNKKFNNQNTGYNSTKTEKTHTPKSAVNDDAKYVEIIEIDNRD